MPIRLFIFDVDGTLAERYTLTLLPGVAAFFDLLRQCPAPARVALATNQGGVGMRRWLEMGQRGQPGQYPTSQEIEERLASLSSTLGGAPAAFPAYASFRYRTSNGYWVPLPPEAEGDPRWESQWRKPNPGMLLQAMRDAGVGPDQTLFVGDSPEDEQAAQAAGCRFLWAADFFSRAWSDCQALDDPR